MYRNFSKCHSAGTCHKCKCRISVVECDETDLRDVHKLVLLADRHCMQCLAGNLLLSCAIMHDIYGCYVYVYIVYVYMCIGAKMYTDILSDICGCGVCRISMWRFSRTANRT